MIRFMSLRDWFDAVCGIVTLVYLEVIWKRHSHTTVSIPAGERSTTSRCASVGFASPPLFIAVAGDLLRRNL